MIWKPHVTVAAVIEQNQRFLLVEEQTTDGYQFNQPAGHLEEGESLIDAVQREVLEETGWQFDPEFVISVQLWRKKTGCPSFLRVCFSGLCHSHDASRPLDDGIIATHWLSREEISLLQHRLRSPLVEVNIDQYLNGNRYPLTLLGSLIY